MPFRIVFLFELYFDEEIFYYTDWDIIDWLIDLSWVSRRNISGFAMGNGNSIDLFSTKTKQLLVRTGIQRGQGTDASVYVILCDNKGGKTKSILLDFKFRDDFKSGHTDNFPIDLK